MKELTLIKSAAFGETECDFYGDGKDFWMTREQIGVALEYSNPRDAIAKIHRRKRARMDRFSGVVKLSTPGGEQEVTVYNRKGIMEICRHSDQPKADAFMDFCWEIMDSLMSGKAKVVGMTEYQKQNISIQKAKLLAQIAAEYSGTYKQVLQAYATKELTTVANPGPTEVDRSVWFEDFSPKRATSKTKAATTPIAILPAFGIPDFFLAFLLLLCVKAP